MKRGFTLIELIIVIAIVGILGAVVVGAINNPAMLQATKHCCPHGYECYRSDINHYCEHGSICK